MKILHCIGCGLAMVVPPTSSRKRCETCHKKKAREYAHDKYIAALATGKIHEYRAKARDYMKHLNENDPVYRLLSRAKPRAKAMGLPFNLEPDDIVIPDKCPVLGTPFEYRTYYTASLDRIDSSKGYVKGNVQVLSHKANAMKNSATKEELLAFAEWVSKTYEA